MTCVCCECREVSLKMLTNDRFCGRLIGKEGRMIKKIREETGTKIVVTKYVLNLVVTRGPSSGVESHTIEP